MKILVLALGLVLGSSQAQQVWKCEADGQVVYTDQPCEKAGRVLPGAPLRVNVAETAASAASAAPAASGVPETGELAAPAASAADAVASAPAARVAPRYPRRDVYMSRVAMQGLMDTDFVLRGYMLRRQYVAATPTP